MKLTKVMVHVRIGKRIFDHMQTIQLYKSKTATAIIEDALEKGLAWYLKQAGAELGYKKEDPLTWEKLADLVKLSVSPSKNNTPGESQEQSQNVTDEQLEEAMKDLFEGASKRLEEKYRHDKNRKP